MPRVTVVLIVTVAAIVLITSFHTTTTRLARVSRPAAAPHERRAPARAPARRHRKPAPTRPRSFTGAPVQQPYGTVQVAVTIRRGRITDIRTLAIPLDSGTSQSINSQAGPLLRSEALRAQGAQIDVISGATYTSDAYAQSLQSALDRARA